MARIEKYTIRVNGKKYNFRAEKDMPLLWVLRDKLKMTGTKFGCGEGACGTCTVLINGKATRSCVFNVSSLKKGDVITTVEGLARKGKLTKVQKAFIEHTAFQCGFCTSGMIMSATALLDQNPAPNRKEIVEAMDGNLCRCGSHVNIIKAIESVAKGK